MGKRSPLRIGKWGPTGGKKNLKSSKTVLEVFRYANLARGKVLGSQWARAIGPDKGGPGESPSIGCLQREVGIESIRKVNQLRSF